MLLPPHPLILTVLDHQPPMDQSFLREVCRILSPLHSGRVRPLVSVTLLLLILIGVLIFVHNQPSSLDNRVMAFALPHTEVIIENLTSGPDGTLWFTENAPGRIGRITPNGQITDFPLPDADNTPSSLASGPDGNLWFTQSYDPDQDQGHHRIGRITPGGQITDFSLPAANNASNSLTLGPDGNLWFAECYDNYSDFPEHGQIVRILFQGKQKHT